jgi:hypothetical protein
MSDKMRWRYGDTNPVVALPLADDRIEIGDLLYQVSERCRPAAALDKGERSALDLPRIFASCFLGVAMQRSPKREAEPVRVATTGVFEFDNLSLGDWDLGDLVGPAVGLDLHLLSQTVMRREHNEEAIARVAKRADRVASTLLVDVVSTVMCGGIFGRWRPWAMTAVGRVEPKSCDPPQENPFLDAT